MFYGMDNKNLVMSELFSKLIQIITRRIFIHIIVIIVHKNVMQAKNIGIQRSNVKWLLFFFFYNQSNFIALNLIDN